MAPDPYFVDADLLQVPLQRQCYTLMSYEEEGTCHMRRRIHVVWGTAPAPVLHTHVYMYVCVHEYMCVCVCVCVCVCIQGDSSLDVLRQFLLLMCSLTYYWETLARYCRNSSSVCLWVNELERVCVWVNELESRDLLQCQKRPTTVSKETYYSVCLWAPTVSSA